MDRSLLLGRMEDQKINKQGAVAWPRKNTTFELVCSWALLTSWILAVNSIPDRAKMQRLVATRWRSAVGTVAVVLALVLEGRRRSRRALTYVALASAAVNHYLATRLNGLLYVTSPGDLLSYILAATAIFYAVFDVLGFLALLFGIREE